MIECIKIMAIFIRLFYIFTLYATCGILLYSLSIWILWAEL